MMQIHQSPKPAVISLSKWLKGVGVSKVTGWRWCKRGWLNPVNIAGRPYLTADDIHQFEARATAGEFAKAPRGAAAISHEARKLKESKLNPLMADEFKAGKI